MDPSRWRVCARSWRSSASPRMNDFAHRWMALAKQTVGADPVVLNKVDAMWPEAFQDPDFRERAPFSPEVMAFVRQAVHAAHAAGGDRLSLTLDGQDAAFLVLGGGDLILGGVRGRGEGGAELAGLVQLGDALGHAAHLGELLGFAG